VDNSSDLHPPLPSSVDPRPPLLPSAVLDLRLPLGTSGGGRGGGGGSSGEGCGGGGRRHRNRSAGGGGDSGTDDGSDTTTPTTGQGKRGTPWSSFYNPWTGTINMWSDPSRPSVTSRPPHAFFAAPSVGPPFTPPLLPLPLPDASLSPPGVPATTSGPRVGSSVYHPVVVTCDPLSTHPMVTRRVAGVTKPVDRL
jgi:hypothetical protein